MPTLQETDAPAYYDSPQIATRYISHTAKIQPGKRVVIYKKYIGFNTGKTDAELQNLEKGKNGEYNGFMSPATARKVRTMLGNWLHSIEQELTDDWTTDTKTAFADPTNHRSTFPTFVTLTLPSVQRHDDNFIKRNLLNRFIITLKEKHGVQHYFWRAEPQKNENIHFHLLIDRWVHWRSIRHDWNKILSDHGYIEAYKAAQESKHSDGYKPDRHEFRQRFEKLRDFHRETGQTLDLKTANAQIKAQMRKAYDEGIKTNWSDPNSTDIHAIDKVENITAYVVKYVTKSDGNQLERKLNEEQTDEIITTRDRKIKGRIWGKSDGLINLKHFEQEVAQEIDFHTLIHDNQAVDFVRHLERTADEADAADKDSGRWKDEESGIVVYQLDAEAHTILRALFPKLFTDYAQHYRRQYNDLYGQKSDQQFLCDIMTKTSTMFGSSIKPPNTEDHVQTDTLATPDSWFNPTEYCPF